LSAIIFSPSIVSAAPTRACLVEFPNAFSGAQVLVLEQNYRSTRTVVALANALVLRRSPSDRRHGV
jgi:superfamily I DNA/RNA helicase